VRCFFWWLPVGLQGWVGGRLNRNFDPSFGFLRLICGSWCNGLLPCFFTKSATREANKRVFVKVSGLRLSQGFWTKKNETYTKIFGVEAKVFDHTACIVMDSEVSIAVYQPL
jgi:hypothetical protein